MGKVRHGGTGRTNIGLLSGDSQLLLPFKDAFDCCGFDLVIHDNIKKLIWAKLFTNVSLSAVTAVLQVDMGYIAENKYAWHLTESLIKEAVMVAKAIGLTFDEAEIIETVRRTSLNNPNGCTSIRADIQNGRKTEVDTISGAVLKTAQQCGIEVPFHECIVNQIHALEGKTR